MNAHEIEEFLTHLSGFEGLFVHTFENETTVLAYFSDPENTGCEYEYVAGS